MHLRGFSSGIQDLLGEVHYSQLVAVADETFDDWLDQPEGYKHDRIDHKTRLEHQG